MNVALWASCTSDVAVRIIGTLVVDANSQPDMLPNIDEFRAIFLTPDALGENPILYETITFNVVPLVLVKTPAL
jgi:hypothetical protein